MGGSLKSAMSNNDDQPATRRDIKEALREMREFILDRESALIWWKVIAL
jgi:hypothetical protein